MMTQIYRNANEVVIHPGSYCLDTAHKTHYYGKYLMKMLSNTARFLKAVKPERPWLRRAELAEVGIQSQYSEHPAFIAAWKSWQEMRSLPWYSRSLVVQEVTVNRNVWMVLNGMRFKWRDVASANWTVRDEAVSVDRMDIWNGRRGLAAVEWARRDTDLTGLSLIELLCRFRELQATDRRDKIYAFRGLALDRESAPVVDYRQSVEHIFLDFARCFVRSGKGLQVLAQAGISRSDINIPSWVPDWGFSNPLQHYFNVHTSGSARLKTFHCGGEQKSDVQLGSEGVTVVVRGIFFDKVARVSPHFKSYLGLPARDQHGFRESMASLIEAHELSYRMVSQLVDEGDANVRDAFLRTMIADEISPKTEEPYGDPAALYNDSLASYRYELRHPDRPRLEISEDARQYLSQMQDAVTERCFALCEQNFMALVPKCVAEGDYICLFPDCDHPHVLREDKEGCLLVGDAYVHVMMYGEAMPEIGLKAVDITLK